MNIKQEITHLVTLSDVITLNYIMSKFDISKITALKAMREVESKTPYIKFYIGRRGHETRLATGLLPTAKAKYDLAPEVPEDCQIIPAGAIVYIIERNVDDAVIQYNEIRTNAGYEELEIGKEE